jgi:hypothetical protein
LIIPLSLSLPLSENQKNLLADARRMNQVPVTAIPKHFYNCNMLDILILNAIWVKFDAVTSLLGKAYFLNGSRNYSHIYGSSTVNLMQLRHMGCMALLFWDSSFLFSKLCSFISRIWEFGLAMVLILIHVFGSSNGSILGLQEFQKHFFESSSCCLGVSNGSYACCMLTFRDKNFCSMSTFSGDSCVKRYQGACVCELICFGT